LRVAVIVNDNSDMNIDAQMLERSVDNACRAVAHRRDVVQVSKGCMGCTPRDGLLIESTGIGAPLPVAAALYFTREEGESANPMALIATPATGSTRPSSSVARWTVRPSKQPARWCT
jgi:G3E family GTPase